jgi:MGT family glycosyltransferase
MAKFLIANMPITGHVNPFIPIAHKLVEHGHEVWWYTGKHFQKKIEAAGATYAPMKAAPDFDDRNPDATFPGRKGLKGVAGLKYDFKHLFLDSAVGQNQDLTEILSDFPADVILSEIIFFGSTLLAPRNAPARAGIGIVPLGLSSQDTAPFGPGLPPNASPIGRIRNRFLNLIIHKIVFGEVQSYANNLRKKFDLPSLQDFFIDAAANKFDVYLQGTTPAFEYSRSDLPAHIHFIGPLLPELQESFTPPIWWDDLKSNRPVIFVTQGTVATDYGNLMLPTIEAFAGEEVLVVAATGNPTDNLNLKEHPANLRLEQFIPYNKLLPNIDVMITNAGYGGVQFALSYGVPLVVAGQTEEKAEICARVGWSGVGINLKTESPKLQQIKRAVTTILNDSQYRHKAQQIQKNFAQYDAPKRAVELLVELAKKKGPILRDSL